MIEPEIDAQIEFLKWAAGDRLRHSKFVGLREDKNPRSVVKEGSSEAWTSLVPMTLRRSYADPTAGCACVQPAMTASNAAAAVAGFCSVAACMKWYCAVC